MSLKTWFPGVTARWYAKQAARVDAERLYDLAQAKYRGRYPVLQGRGFSGDAVVRHAGTHLRDYARHLDENSDLAIGILDTLVDQVAPVTVEPMVLDEGGEPIDRINDTLYEMWGEWADVADVSWQMPWGELKRLVARSLYRDGEVFVRHLRGNVRGVMHRSPVRYALQVLESDFCPDTITDEHSGAIQGVRLNRWGRPSAYHMHRRHPGGVLPFISAQVRDDTRLVPADDLLHLKMVKRHPQIRGVSVLAGVSDRLLAVKHYEESERVAARVAASFAAVIKRSAPFGQSVRYTAENNRAIELEAGMIMDPLGPGEELQIVNTSRPNNSLEPFRNAMLKAASRGTRTSYSSISADYSGTYSSQRQQLVESKAGYDALRDYWIAQFLRPVYREFVAMAVASGVIDTEGRTLTELSAATFCGATIPWIDPKREVEADVMAINAGIKSRRLVQRERGIDGRRIDEERARDDFEPAQPPAIEEQPEDETADA